MSMYIANDAVSQIAFDVDFSGQCDLTNATINTSLAYPAAIDQTGYAGFTVQGYYEQQHYVYLNFSINVTFRGATGSGSAEVTFNGYGGAPCSDIANFDFDIVKLGT